MKFCTFQDKIFSSFTNDIEKDDLGNQSNPPPPPAPPFPNDLTPSTSGSHISVSLSPSLSYFISLILFDF